MEAFLPKAAPLADGTPETVSLDVGVGAGEVVEPVVPVPALVFFLAPRLRLVGCDETDDWPENGCDGCCCCDCPCSVVAFEDLENEVVEVSANDNGVGAGLMTARDGEMGIEELVVDGVAPPKLSPLSSV